MTERNACLTGDLTEGLTLLQTEVPKDVPDLLTNQDHDAPSSLSSLCPTEWATIQHRMVPI